VAIEVKHFSTFAVAPESYQIALQIWQSCALYPNEADQIRPRIDNRLILILSHGHESSILQRRIPHMKSKYNSRTPPPFHHPRAGKDRVAERLDAASELAVAALGFIAADPEQLSRFLALSGIDAAAIRTAAAEPGFLGGVLAYIAGNERTLLAFAAQAGVAPEEVEKARGVLAGADWEREVP
jgi:hypothetical protein